MTATVWTPEARVPDWVVLGRIREHIAARQPIPPSLCPREELPAYVPALIAAGHSPTEITLATGLRVDRHIRSTP